MITDRIQSGLNEGQKRYGSRLNADTCAACGHSHNGDVCDDCPCRIFKSRENATEKGICDICKQMKSISWRAVGGIGTCRVCDECLAEMQRPRENDFAKPGECRRCGTSKEGKGFCEECTKQMKELNNNLCAICAKQIDGWKKYTEHMKETHSCVLTNANSQQIRAVESMLANDEASSDEELVRHFMKEVKLTEQEARSFVAQRSKYLRGVR